MKTAYYIIYKQILNFNVGKQKKEIKPLNRSHIYQTRTGFLTC